MRDHPEKEILRWDYLTANSGEYVARLDHHAWGDNANLFCYFTEIDTGYPFRLSVWRSKDYRPWESGPAFDEEPLGGVFKIKVGVTRNGLPKFLSAEPS